MLQVTRELEGTATPTSGAIRRSNVPGAGKELQKSPIDSIKTVHDILLYGSSFFNYQISKSSLQIHALERERSLTKYSKLEQMERHGNILS